MARWLVVLGLLAGWWAWGAAPAAARPLGQPAPPRVLSLDPDTPEMALLTWDHEPGARYQLCASPTYRFTEGVVCFDAGHGSAWSVGMPQEDGAVLYLTLQGCRDGECAEPVRAGAIGRRRRGGQDFYGVAVPLPGGRARLGGFVRRGTATLHFYRAAAGTAARLQSGCVEVPAGEACAGAEVSVPGSLAGIGAVTTGGRERGLTFQVRDTPSIAFMFDDGTGTVAGGRYVMQRVLDEFSVKGSFFLTGRAMQSYPDAVRALVAGGHRVGNHTWSHPYLTGLSDAAIALELDHTEALYRALVPGGTLRPCFRAPYGAFNGRVLDAVNARGYRQYTQTISSLDYLGISAGAIVANVMREARDGALVSFHTQEPQTAIALRTLVPLLLAEGYRFALAC